MRSRRVGERGMCGMASFLQDWGRGDGYWYTCHAPLLAKKKEEKKEKGELDRWGDEMLGSAG